ncbi:transposase [Planctomycetaceae bacterium SH139]
MSLFRKRLLPHVDVDDKPYFITACLFGSVNNAGLSDIKRYRNMLDERPCPDDLTIAEWEYKKYKLVFKFVDELLDHASPVNHLKDDRLARIVFNAFLHFADERYRLFAFVVMPSHHHWLFLPTQAWCDQLAASRQPGQPIVSPRESISHSIQSYTANLCNRTLQKTGPFWQRESFDHFARDEAELLRICHYIENNPVKAGLCNTPGDYRWSSAAYRLQHNIPLGHPLPKIMAF